LKILLNLTQYSGGAALISSELNGKTTDDFMGAGLDGAVNPSYTDAAGSQQNPQWQNVGFTVSGTDQGNHDFYRANSYAVDFYLTNNDPRGYRFYALNTQGVIRGRAIGSQIGSEHNTLISAVGPGILQSPTQSSYILPAFESLFFQAEALQRGFIAKGTNVASAQDAYQQAITESFRVLFRNVSGYDYTDTAKAYYQQGNAKTNWANATDPVTLIITQEWAALNMFDPITSWNNWKRLDIPSANPVSIYPGTQAAHAPIRLIYPTDEYTTNSANTNTEGVIDPINSKIFWMP